MFPIGFFSHFNHLKIYSLLHHICMNRHWIYNWDEYGKPLIGTFLRPHIQYPSPYYQLYTTVCLYEKSLKFFNINTPFEREMTWIIVSKCEMWISTTLRLDKIIFRMRMMDSCDERIVLFCFIAFFTFLRIFFLFSRIKNTTKFTFEKR